MSMVLISAISNVLNSKATSIKSITHQGQKPWFMSLRFTLYIYLQGFIMQRPLTNDTVFDHIFYNHIFHFYE